LTIAEVDWNTDVQKKGDLSDEGHSLKSYNCIAGSVSEIILEEMQNPL
jgi:hypothetical protein